MKRKLIMLASAILLLVCFACKDEKEPPVGPCPPEPPGPKLVSEDPIRFEIAIGEYKDLWNGEDQTDHYQIILSTKTEITSVIDPEERTLKMHIYAPSTTTPEIIPSGKYEYDNTEPMGIVKGENTIFYYGTGTSLMIESLALDIDHEAGTYRIDGKLEVPSKLTRAKETPSSVIIPFSYEGKIEIEVEPPVITDPYEGYLVLSSGMMKYEGLFEKGIYEMELFLSNADIDPTHGDFSGTGECLGFTLFTTRPSDSQLLADGIYEFAETSSLFGLKGNSTGYYKELEGEAQKSDVPPTPPDPTLPGPDPGPGPGPSPGPSQKNFKSGSVEVKFENGGYTIAGVVVVSDNPFSTDNDEEIKFVYRGSLELTGWSRPYSVGLTRSHTTAEFTIAYYERELELAYGDFNIETGYIFLQTEGYRNAQSTGDLSPDDEELKIYITWDRDIDADHIPQGSYTGRRNDDFASMRYGYGTLNRFSTFNTKLGTWLTIGNMTDYTDVSINDENHFRISRSGDSYTLDFEFLDDRFVPNTIKGRYTGPIELRR